MIRNVIDAVLREMPDEPDKVAAEVVIERATREQLLELVVSEVGHRRRFGVAIHERAVVSLPAAQRTMGSPQVLTLLLDRFGVPGKFEVSYAEATVEQHRARIEYLQAYIEGFQATIATHEWAISEIQRKGVRCLSELAPANRASRSARGPLASARRA